MWIRFVPCVPVNFHQHQNIFYFPPSPFLYVYLIRIWILFNKNHSFISRVVCLSRPNKYWKRDLFSYRNVTSFSSVLYEKWAGFVLSNDNPVLLLTLPPFREKSSRRPSWIFFAREERLWILRGGVRKKFRSRQKVWNKMASFSFCSPFPPFREKSPRRPSWIFSSRGNFEY